MIILYLHRVWVWLKKYWKLFLIPLTVIGISLLWLLGWRKRNDPKDPTLDLVGETLDRLLVASEERDEALVGLEQRHIVKLVDMTNQQRAEFEKIKNRPIDEVAAWIDRL